jgi:RHS repeat-associated protein
VGYTPDAQGNRTSRTVDGMLDASWVWDELSSLPVRVGEYDASGTFTTAWLPDPASATGSPLAQTGGGASTWLLSDPFLNTVASVSTTGTTLSGTRDLNAFGVPLTPATGSLADVATGFAGQYLDDATGLYDMRARDYDPSSGRFTATDPVAVPTGTAYFSGYTYGYNNPLVYSDASGLSAIGQYDYADTDSRASKLIASKLGGLQLADGYADPTDGADLIYNFVNGIGPSVYYFDANDQFTKDLRKNSWYNDDLSDAMFRKGGRGWSVGDEFRHVYSLAEDARPFRVIKDYFQLETGQRDKHAWIFLGSHISNITVLDVRTDSYSVLIQIDEIVASESATRNPISRKGLWPSHSNGPLSSVRVVAWWTAEIRRETGNVIIRCPGIGAGTSGRLV